MKAGYGAPKFPLLGKGYVKPEDYPIPEELAAVLRTWDYHVDHLPANDLSHAAFHLSILHTGKLLELPPYPYSTVYISKRFENYDGSWTEDEYNKRKAKGFKPGGRPSSLFP